MTSRLFQFRGLHHHVFTNNISTSNSINELRIICLALSKRLEIIENDTSYQKSIAHQNNEMRRRELEDYKGVMRYQKQNGVTDYHSDQ
jgi:hypothetical protein